MLFTRLTHNRFQVNTYTLKVNQTKQIQGFSANHIEAYSNRYCDAKFVYKSLNQNEQIMNKEMPVIPCWSFKVVLNLSFGRLVFNNLPKYKTFIL